MINKKTYNSFCRRLKELKEDRIFAIENNDKEAEKKCNEEIKMIIVQMKTQGDILSKKSNENIDKYISPKYRKRTKKEKKKYENVSRYLDKLVRKEEINDWDIQRIVSQRIFLKQTKIRILVSLTIVMVAGLTGCMLNKKNKSKSIPETPTETTYDMQNNQEYSTSEEEKTIEDTTYEDNIYSEKDSTIVNFDDDKEKSESNEDTQQDKANTEKSTTEDENKDKETKKEDTKKDKENKKEEIGETGDLEQQIGNRKLKEEYEVVDRDKVDPIEIKKDKDNEDKIDNIDYDNSEDLDLDNKDENHNDIVIEEPAPSIPGDTPIEEDINNPSNNEEHINNPSNNEEHFDDDNNSSNENISNDEIKDPSDENKQPSLNIPEEEPAPNVPGDTPIEEDSNNSENKEEYFDNDGNQISKEEWEKLQNELVNNSKVVSDKSSEITTQKEELQKTKEILEQIQEYMEVSQENSMQEEVEGPILEMSK